MLAELYNERVETLITLMLADESVRLPGTRRWERARHAASEGIDVPDGILGQPPSDAVHLSLGQEVVAPAVCSALPDADTLATTHRGNGHVLARGLDLEVLYKEVMGKAFGSIDFPLFVEGTCSLPWL